MAPLELFEPVEGTKSSDWSDESACLDCELWWASEAEAEALDAIGAAEPDGPAAGAGTYSGWMIK